MAKRQSNNGKTLESLVAIIQQSYENNPNVEIKQNVKLIDKNGRKAEIDILVSTVVNGFTINIAFECKDYNKPVPVEKIDAFNSKCNRIDEIHKKIFVSRKGYQIGAQKTAVGFGIDLYKLEEVNTNLISEILDIEQTQLVSGKINLQDYTIHLKSGMDIKKSDINDWLCLKSNNSEESVLLFILKRIDEVRQEEMRKKVLHLVRDKIAPNHVDKEERLMQTGNIRFIGNVYYLTTDSEKLYIDSIDFVANFIFKIHKPYNTLTNRYTDIGSHEEEASLVTFQFSENELIFVKIQHEEMQVFNKSSKGVVDKLTTLGTYNPETDTISHK